MNDGIITVDECIKQYEALLERHRIGGAVLDTKRCTKAMNLYWKQTEKWKKASAEWRSAFCTAARLASGLDLFSGGWGVHPCGDPESMWNLYRISVSFRWYELPDCEVPRRFGPEALRIYYRNIEKSARYLSQFYGGRTEPIADGLKGIRYAARIFGIEI